jgi:predicted metalloprotease with PDZ domain
VSQSGKLFGYRHYDTFRFLVTLSDHISGRAVDHHQSLDNRRPAKFLTDDTMLTRYTNFIPHDLVHSWNGKYRAPASAHRISSRRRMAASCGSSKA